MKNFSHGFVFTYIIFELNTRSTNETFGVGTLIAKPSSFPFNSGIISPQPNVYDFSFLSPCPTSGIMMYGKKDELVPLEYISELDKRLSAQKGIKVEFQSVPDANHFFSKNEVQLTKYLDKYIKKETALY